MRIPIAIALASIALVAAAQETKVVLKEGPGKDKAAICTACHSVDYLEMNSKFLNKAAWTASVNKMINAFGAPIDPKDVDTIATYLAVYYGSPE